ncbi:restriction endonuclease subunit S [Streptococcus suis]|uniref:restriction endonuclease subunit S n=1 Tax=Streptococcus suis TaxID=1307 RepID=UPI00196144D6|nr:restriction endonuclease subunit S [Streptococcus suis]MBM7137873.1 restriction endonuclease subunit S [Streptococcus suis]MCO8172576.1 restriction endonuclease subunit S [Streptococcus suis]MCO8202006.1 restriction endonuclease subunit S [Streptococcus suis]MCO8226576.1 restriction endonuclease subunit S [Streptococcus suis]MCO8228622.1 restriction endonuclease subunit S [Streptococcus suis]
MADGTVQEVEVPYEIPDSWEWVRLGNIGCWGSGATPSKSNLKYYEPQAVPWLLTGDLTDGYITHIPNKISELALEKTSVKLNPTGSVLIAMYGATIGKLGILTFPATTNQACCACNTLFHVEKLFLFYFLMSARKNFTARAEGGAQPNISKEKIINTLFPLPPLAEQKRIVTQIERALKQVEIYAENYHKLQELDRAFPDKLKKSILQYAMQGKLVAQNPNDEPVEILLEKIRAEKQKLFEEGKLKKKDLTEMVVIKGDDNSHYQDVPYDIPESWKWVRLNNILDVRDGTHNTPKYVNEGVPLLTSKNLVNGKIVKEPSKLISIEDSLEINKRSKVDKNDILLAMIGTVGNPVLVPELDYEFSVKNVAILKHITELNMKFTYYFIQYHSIELKKISSGAVQNFVSLKTLRQILFPLPPLAEQRRIVSKISKIFSVIETLV